jgi:TolB-like protein/AraC-like DNA-binding protein/Tfp pilus assembly protein PilF
MPELSASDSEFLSQVTAAIQKNLPNEHFGVSELADEMNMSRSNLLRKVKKLTKLSVSQLISQERLKQGMTLLRTTSNNVSEVSHQVGFSSTSYFIKCFREYYGYPPGEVGKRAKESGEVEAEIPAPKVLPGDKRKLVVGTVAGLATLLLVGFLFYTYSSRLTAGSSSEEKSIAVLPFKNDSNDSTNLYLINGLMESTLNNLQQIKDLKVISRTSAEKYRNTSLSVPEMAKELNVKYIVEGSGQKIGDRILLNIQLIDAVNDRHLWGNQYRREVKDIFALQQEVAKNIAEEIQAVITPEEEKRIDKIPTRDLEAYNLLLKGREAMNDRRDPEKGIPFFKQAIERDPEFALAYAAIAIAYFNLDLYKTEKQYTAEIGSYSDKALLYDPKSAECLMAKAFYYVHKKEYSQAEVYLMKALEYNPNSADVIGFLSDFYGLISPNTAKYLEFALKGLRINAGLQDSVSKSYNYLRLGNALAQTGFVDEGLEYVDKSLEFNPKNAFSRWLRAFLLYAKSGNLNHTRDLLIEEYKKDSSRFDILKDIGKVSYYLGDQKGAFRYFQQFVTMRERMQLDVYPYEDLLIATVYEKEGLKKKSEELLKSFKAFADNDHSIYKNLFLTGYYAHLGDTRKAMEHYRLFSKEENYQYWIILFWDKDPEPGPLLDLPEYKEITRIVQGKFWKQHEEIKVMLEEKGLLKSKTTD